MTINLDKDLEWGFPEYHANSREQFAKNREIRKFLRPIFNLQGNEIILDLGCGIGTLGKLIAPFLKNNGVIIGIDKSPELIKFGNEHWARRASIRLEVGNAYNIPYSDNFFDVVASFGLFEYISNLKQVLSEVMRVLKHPGKLITIQVNVKEFNLSPWHPKYAGFYYDLVKGMELAGVDLDLTRLYDFCELNNLNLERFVFPGEYQTVISEGFIKLVERGMQSYTVGETMLHQICDFNYQFLKLRGWTKETIWNLIKNQYSVSSHIAFLREHLEETYIRRTPINVFRIQLAD